MLNQETVDKLSQLPLNPQTTWAGDRRKIKIAIKPLGRSRYYPDVILWINPSNRTVLGSEVVEPGSPINAALDNLVKTMQRPMIGSPLRPGRIVVCNKKLQNLLQEVLQPLGITVSYQSKIGEIDLVIKDMEGYLKSIGGPSYLAGEGVTPELCAKLFKAAANYWHSAPWEHLTDSQPLTIEINRWGAGTAYAVVMGNGRQTYGLAIYFKLKNLEDAYLSQGRASKLLMKEMDSMSVVFGRADEIGGRALDEIAEHGWEIADPLAYPAFFRLVNGESRELNAQEMEMLCACLYAVSAFVARHRAAFALDMPIPTISETINPDQIGNDVAVTVKYPVAALVAESLTKSAKREKKQGSGAGATRLVDVAELDQSQLGEGAKRLISEMRKPLNRLIEVVPANNEKGLRELLAPGSRAEIALELYGMPFFFNILGLSYGDVYLRTAIKCVGDEVVETFINCFDPGGKVLLTKTTVNLKPHRKEYRIENLDVGAIRDGEEADDESFVDANVWRFYSNEEPIPIIGLKHCDEVERLFITSMIEQEFLIGEILGGVKLWRDFKRKAKVSGTAATWAACVEYIVVLLNFLEGSQSSVGANYGVSGKTVGAKYKEIERLLNIHQYDERYSQIKHLLKDSMRLLLGNKLPKIPLGAGRGKSFWG